MQIFVAFLEKLNFNPVCREWNHKARNMLIFRATTGKLLQDSMSWVGCQNNLIDHNFHLQKSLEIFEKKNQLTKSDLKSSRE